MMLMSVVASPKQLAFEKYNPANKRAERPADQAPLFAFLYTTEDGRRKARKKDEEGYKPMPLKENKPCKPRLAAVAPHLVGNTARESRRHDPIVMVRLK